MTDKIKHDSFDLKRLNKLIDKSIDLFELDLTDLTVLTEGASGNFVATSLIAAKANAKRVYAITKDSKYGNSEDVIDFCNRCAKRLGLKKIVYSKSSPAEFASMCDIVTNLGFVRPINKDLIDKLPTTASISLMWEPWELRKSDIDIDYCHEKSIPVIGTNESDTRLSTFKYVGILAAKLLLESGIEIYNSNLSIIGTNPFGESIMSCLTSMGASCKLYVPNEIKENENKIYSSDAIVIAEHRDSTILIGEGGLLDISKIKDNHINLTHICGNVEIEADDSSLLLNPKVLAPFGFMSLTTEYVGPKPIVDLHTAGLKLSEIITRSRLKGLSIKESLLKAEKTGLGIPV